MKKLMIGLAVAAAAGGVFAQSGAAECAGPVGTGPAWCYSQTQQQQQPYVQGNRYYGNVWGNRAPFSGAPWGLAQASPYRGYVTPHPRTRHDRDGDGIRNRRDRYPDDPRYY